MHGTKLPLRLRGSFVILQAMAMHIPDRIYGDITIEAPVIAELIASPPFQRLKKISQDGAPHFIQPVRNVTRYEHSIGVWYLSHRYSRPIEEQIAALLHDISHTAFSHVIDFVVQDEKHEFHDTFNKQVILDSDIPNILQKHGIDLQKVINKEHYVLLENDLPDISFDRWDYFMRDGFAIGFLPKATIEQFLDGVSEKDSTLYFSDTRLAALFSILFANFSRLIWLDPTSHGAFFVLAEALKLALHNGHITEEDFFTDDEILLDKLHQTNDERIHSLLDRLSPGNEFVYADKDTAEFFGPNKPRTVDPFVQTDTGLERISELVPSLGYFYQEFEEKYHHIGVKPV